MLFIYTVLAMHFDIRLLRERGKPIPRRQLDRVTPRRGDVYIQLEQKSPMGRPSLVAYLHCEKPGASEIRLYDACINGMATTALVITGTEIIGDVAYAQSWHCRVV